MKVSALVIKKLSPLPFKREKSVCGFGIVPVTSFFTFISLAFVGIPNLDTAALEFFFIKFCHQKIRLLRIRLEKRTTARYLNMGNAQIRNIGCFKKVGGKPTIIKFFHLSQINK
jgi:hypothetical protein